MEVSSTHSSGRADALRNLTEATERLAELQTNMLNATQELGDDMLKLSVSSQVQSAQDQSRLDVLA